MTLVGVIGCTLLLVGSFGIRDSMMFFLDTLDNDVSNYTTKVILSEGTAKEDALSLADELDGVVNYNIAARKRGDNIVFLRKIVPGGTDDSYGIEVAKLAGIPNEVISRAKVILAETEARARAMNDKEVEIDDIEITLDDCINDSVIDDIRAADLNNMSPFEAMSLLNELQKKLK